LYGKKIDLIHEVDSAWLAGLQVVIVEGVHSRSATFDAHATADWLADPCPKFGPDRLSMMDRRE
jgi:hypothetical protein